MRFVSTFALVLCVGCAGGGPTQPSPITHSGLSADAPRSGGSLESAVVVVAPESARFTLYAPDLLCGTGIAMPGVTHIKGDVFRLIARGVKKSEVTWIVFHDDSKGLACAKNITTHPKPGMLHPVESTSGTTFTFDPDAIDQCGTYQIDIAIDGTLVVGTQVNYPKDCAPKPQPESVPAVPPKTPTPPPAVPPVVPLPPPSSSTLPGPPVVPPPPPVVLPPSPVPPAPVVLPPPPVPPPPPPLACEAVNRPGAVIQSWSGGAQTISGTVQVSNDGAWTVGLLAASSRQQYDSNQHDYIKDTAQHAVPCGGQATLSVSYPWRGHHYEYWWLEIRRNGVFVSKSPVIVSTVN